MKNCFNGLFLLAMLLLPLMLDAQQSVYFQGGIICPTDSWKLVFYDEFNGNTVDPNKWINATTQIPNQSTVLIEPQNAIVNGGLLRLVVKNDNPTWNGSTYQYSIGQISSQWTYSFQYGRFETRCKMPHGGGFWPAFWMFGGLGTEIDVFEYGSFFPNTQNCTIHHWNSDNPSKDVANYGAPIVSSTVTDYSLDFHLFAAEWDPFYIRFYIDGAQVFQICRYDNLDGSHVTACDLASSVYVQIPSYPQGSPNKVQVIAGNSVGGPFNNNQLPNSADLPNEMDVDYIRVYQRTPQSGFTDLCATASVSGSDIVCSSNTYTYQYTGPIGTTAIWSLSPNLSQISSTSTSITVKANTSAPGPGWVKATFSPYDPCPQTVATKTIWIGAPASPVFSTVPARTLCVGSTENPAINFANGVTTYNWSFTGLAGGLILSPMGTVCSVEGWTAGTYFVKVSQSNQCGTSATESRSFKPHKPVVQKE
jgi:beta-glucanase (GH16 family)